MVLECLSGLAILDRCTSQTNLRPASAIGSETETNLKPLSLLKTLTSEPNPFLLRTQGIRAENRSEQDKETDRCANQKIPLTAFQVSVLMVMFDGFEGFCDADFSW